MWEEIKMNRDMKRAFDRKAYDRKYMPFSVDAQKIVTHNKVKQAMDEGIVMGFYCAINMLDSLCDEVAGIGEKRKGELIRKYKEKMVKLKERIQKEG